MAMLDKMEVTVGRVVAVLILLAIFVLVPGPVHDWLNGLLRYFGVE